MKRIAGLIFSVLIIACLLLPSSGAQDEYTMILLASQGSRVKAQTWIDFLKKNELTVEHYVLSELDQIKKYPYITIMGGLDEPGIKELLAEVIGAEETASLGEKGAHQMFLKEDVWEPGQKVLIFAGNDVDAAAEARTGLRDTWMEYLTEWFDLEEVPGGLRAY
jgi:hypothetical protein